MNLGLSFEHDLRAHVEAAAAFMPSTREIELAFNVVSRAAVVFLVAGRDAGDWRMIRTFEIGGDVAASVDATGPTELVMNRFNEMFDQETMVLITHDATENT